MTSLRKPAVRRWSPLVLTSVAALATAFMDGPARAQTTSFNSGNPTVVSGSVTFDRGVTTPGTEVYTVNSRTAVLDFTPNDTALLGGAFWINFQNSGTTVRYTNGANTPTFTVLNRIVPVDQTRPVQFNGRVISEIRAGQTVTPGGDVWFYSPGGIVLGTTSAFDVGSLLLTARDPTNGTGVIGSTTSFRGGGSPGAFISLEPGASVNATSEGSYIALVAPQVRQNGNVRVNGSAAYVAADAATLSINAGLFAISVETGTDSSLAINHQGSTTGPSSLGASDPHRIYMVAVPKNDAISLFLGGSGTVGFDAATSASIENGRILLSSGRNVFEGNVVASPGAPFATVNLSSGRFTSNVVAGATTDAFVASTTGTASFTGNLTLNAGQRAHVGARRAGETLSIGGNLFISTQSGSLAVRQSGNVSAFDFTGGQSLLYAENGGIVTVGGTVDVRADAYERTGSGSPTFLNTIRGGTANVFATTNGSITVGGNTYTSAFAGSASTGPSYSNLLGGTVIVSTESGGTISLNGGNNQIWACGCGFTDQFFGSLIGGIGSVRTGTTGGRIQAPGFLSINANGLVFNQNAIGSAVSRGGNVFLTSVSGAINLGSLSMDAGATGVGGSNAAGGQTTGGSAFLAANSGGSVTVQGTVNVSASATSRQGSGGLGGAATAGTAQISAFTGGTLSIGGATSVSATALGGSGSLGGGAAVGGSAVVLGNGAMTLGNAVTLSASATGGANESIGAFGGSGGNAQAGRAFIQANTGTITLGGPANLTAIGTGGSSTGAGGNGGDGTGGLARIEVIAASGRLTLNGAASLNSSGIGGAGLGGTSVGGDGFGGVQGSNFINGSYLFAGAGMLTINGPATLLAEGRGGAGGDAGDGFGGFGSITSYDGAIVVTGATSASVSGFGGNSNGSDPGDFGGEGGDGEGGEFFINAQANTGSTGSVRLADVAVTARGTGGVGSAGIGGEGGDGGNGFGGFIQSYGSASSLGVTLGNAIFDVSGVGGLAGAGGAGAAGQAGFEGGFGGDGIAGIANIGTQSGIDRPANTGFHTFGSASLIANGTAGAGGAGGAGGTGGAGGRGGEGGLGQGGGTVLLVRGTPVTGGALTMTARGTGGAGGAGGAGTTVGAAGVAGDGDGGSAAIIISNRFQRTERGRATIGAITADSSGIGGAATSGVAEINVSGADATFAAFDYVSAGATFVSADPTVPRPAFLVSVVDGTVNITGALRLSVAGVFNLTGPLSAQTISIASRGIFLGPNALLGGANTQSIVLSNFVPGGSILLGGEDQDDSTYSISDAEFARLRANQIEVRGQTGQTGQSSVTVRNLSVTGSGGTGASNLIGPNAEFRISGDVVRVEGAISMTGAAATDTLSLIGGRRVEVVTDRGGLISMTGPATGDVTPLGGTLSLSGPVIGVGTNALLTQLAADPRFEGRNTLLSAAPTTPVPAGYVQANRLILTTTNVAAIQNSGTATAFGGFTAGLGGLLVRAPDGAQPGSSPAQVVVYGRVQRPGGGFYDSTDVGGGAAFGTGQASLFDRTSTVNGCAVGASCGSEPATIVATVSAIEEVLAEAEDEAELVEVPTIDVVQVVDQGDLVVQPAVTEPVSGAGNTGLWDDDSDRPSGSAPTAGGQTR